MSTEDDAMTEVLTAAQMRAIEQAAIDSGEVTGLELMERAGRGVVDAIMEWRPELAETPHRAVVLCGPGNNGGDGFVVARLLKQRGWEVEVFLYGDQAKLPPDAAVNARRWRELGDVSPLGWQGACEAYGYADVCLDALFGIGLTRPLEGDAARLIKEMHFDPCICYDISIDMPSGVCSDSGRVLGEYAVWAELTIAFHRLKVGHVLADGPARSKEVRVLDIGL